MCSKERECTRKRANSDGCYLFEYETGIVFLSSRSQPSTHLKRREHQQPHVQLEDFKKVGHFPCPEPECEQVLPSKQGLSNHRRAAHKSDSSDQPLSSTGRRRQPRRQKSARKDATDMQCCSKNLPPRHKNTERTASSSGRRRRVGSTAADRSAQAAAAACAAGEEALDWVDNNQEERQDMAVVTKRMANLALRRANEEQELRPNYEHETESSDVDEDEYVVESDDDLPAVEHRSSVDMRRESLAEILDLGTSGTLARIGASLFPGKREERWVDPLPEKLQFQQQKNKIAELKCKYSRANAKVRWYKGRKELFSDGSKYEILIDKQSITLIINNLDPDDSGKYKCEANGMPTNSFVTVEGPSIKYVFLTPLPNTMDIYRTKQGVLACKLDSPRAPLVWQRDGKPIDVDDPRYQIENDAAGCFTLTIRVVERIDQGMWTATVNKDVNSKCQVYVVEDPRDTFVVPEQLRNETAANEEKAPDDRDKVPGEPPVTADGKTKYGAENESREKPRLAKRTKQSAPAGRSLRVRGQTSGEPVVLNFDRTRAELELVAPASNCCINVLTPVRPSQRGKYGRSRANTANAGAAPAASTSTARTTRSRVVAINEAGPSAPPTPSTSQICTTRLLKPQIITAQRKWKVRAGKTLSLGIKFVGTPDPSVCWVKAGGAGTLPPELIMEDHIKGNTSIFFPAAKRSESGTYELRLKNNVGETEGHFEVLVQDRPAPPKGSLAVDNVARDSCTLSWQPPEDDGGSEVTNYVVECRGVGSQVWVPVNNVVGTNSTVPNLQEGHEYEFRVCAVNAFGCSDPLNTDSAVLAKDPYGSFDESDAEDPAEEVPPGTVEIGLRSLDTPKGQRTRSGTAPGKSRRLAPVNNAASADQSADKAHAQNTPKAQRTRSGTVQRKSRRLAPVECAPSAAQNADKPPAQNTSVGRRTTRSAGTGAAPLTPPRQRMVNLDESSNQEDEVFVEAHPMQPVTADGTPTLPGGIPRNSQGPIDVVQKSTPTRGKKNTVNAEGEADKAIVAKNKAGPGQPTDPSDMIMLPSTSDAPRRSRRIAASTAVSALHQIADKEPAAETLSNLAKLLELCGQREAWSWEELEQHNGCDFSEWKKIAEGSYADVYKFGDTVFKVIRLAATPEEPDEPMVVSAKQVFNELFITSELGKSIPTFIKLVMAKVVCGKFPGPLLEQFNKFKYLNESAQNLPPLDNDAAKFALMGMVASGDTLESYLKKEKTKNEQRYSIFLQIAFALAVAEKKYDFEHRDLHTGNVLVEHCRDNENIRFLYGNQQFDVASKGVRVTIIDFSLSHFRIDGHLFFDDLSKDPDLFTGNGVSCENGDYQFNTYRMMQEKPKLGSFLAPNELFLDELFGCEAL